MTDEQLTWIFQTRLSHHNGFKCSRLLQGDACYPGAPRCEGQTTIVKGRLRYTGTCGEPCSFVCDDADSLQKDIDTLLRYARVIEPPDDLFGEIWCMMNHARIFIVSREKMHPDGVKLYDELKAKIETIVSGASQLAPAERR